MLWTQVRRSSAPCIACVMYVHMLPCRAWYGIGQSSLLDVCHISAVSLLLWNVLNCHPGKPEGQWGHGTAYLWRAVKYSFRWVKPTFLGTAQEREQPGLQECPVLRACPASQVQPAACQLHASCAACAATQLEPSQQQLGRCISHWSRDGTGMAELPVGMWLIQLAECAWKQPNGCVPHWIRAKIWALLFKKTLGIFLE